MSIVTRVLKIPSSQYPNTETQSRQKQTFAEELILNTFSKHCELLTHWHSLPLHLAEGRNLKSERLKSPILLEDYRSTWQYSVSLGSVGPFILAMSVHCV